ncbi:DUF456 domain-containing protein [Candidatus Berkelbacteria bacterium]|nr:DUF456 domain-containing protein [Candidatus Berkelbacteria bacterium]
MFDAIIITLEIALVLIGLAGIILPALPGLPLIFLALLTRSISTDFQSPSVLILTVLFAITIFIYITEFIAAPAGAKALGSSKSGIVGAVIGTVASILLLPISFWFIIFAPFLGAVIGELAAGSSKKKALKVGAGTALGFFFTITVKLAIATGFIVVLILSFF